MMQLMSQDDTVLMEIENLERQGNDLVIKGKVFGTMPIAAKLSPSECRNAFKMLGLRLLFFVISLPFRRG